MLGFLLKEYLTWHTKHGIFIFVNHDFISFFHFRDVWDKHVNVRVPGVMRYYCNWLGIPSLNFLLQMEIFRKWTDR